MDNNPVTTEKKHPSGLPIIESIFIPLSPHPDWQLEADAATRLVNDFIFECYEDTHPPQIVLAHNNFYVPKYAVIAETLLRVMICQANCNAAMTILVCKALEQIEGFNPWEIASKLAEERCQEYSAAA